MKIALRVLVGLAIIAGSLTLLLVLALTLKAAVVLLFIPFALAAMAFWVWMVVDCAQRVSAGEKDKIGWLLVVILLHFIGALAYFFFGRSQKPLSRLTPPQAAPPPPPFNAGDGQSVGMSAMPPPAPPPTGAPESSSPNAPAKCPKCGAVLPTAASEGLCPRCLVQMNLAASTQFTGAAPAGPPPLPEEIAKHFPQLEVMECLGRGGMGVVYKARQPRLNRFVALKILAPNRQQDPQFAERFIREAQALAKLNHPNIVTVFDFGEADGMYYLLMEYVDGMTLRGLLHGGKLAPEQAMAIVPRICEALQFAHEQGVVHRDIKPENVLVDKQGRVKIADFGIARMMGVGGLPEHTRDRYVIGTPYYMAPEQVEHPLTVDHRADIYSLGVVFYEMLTGELPLGRFALPSQKVQVDVRLDDVVLRTLEKEPQRRYQHASQVKTDVENISGVTAAAGGFAGTPPPMVPPSMLGAAGTPGGKPRSVFWPVMAKLAFGMILLGLLAFTVLFVMWNFASKYIPSVLHSSGSALHGSGVLATRTLALAPFSKIDVTGSPDLDVQIGTPLSVTVSADDNIQPLIEARVEDDTLHIRTTRYYNSDLGVKFAITVPSLDAMALIGSSTVNIHKLNANTFTLSAKGAGDVSMDGVADKLDVEVMGAGDVKARDLTAKDVSVYVAGAGNVAVNASQSLNVSIAGAGSVSYAGHPATVQKRVAGLGSIQEIADNDSANTGGNSTAAAAAPVEASAPAEPVVSSTSQISPAQLEVLQAQLKGAQGEVVRLQQLYDSGQSPATDLYAAMEQVDILQAQIAGDAEKEAEARLTWTEKRLQLTEKLLQAGVVPSADYQKLATEVETLKAQLKAVTSAASAPATPSAVDLQKARDAANLMDLQKRYNAAVGITDWQSRDAALSALAKSAAVMDQPAIVKQALGNVTDWQKRDVSIRECARSLLKNGDRAKAIDLANTITDWQMRDATLAEMSR